MNNNIFSKDCQTSKELKITNGAPIANVAKTITAGETKNGKDFAKEITDLFVSDFEKPEDELNDHKNKAILETKRIYHSQKTCDMVSLDRISTVETMLEELGSELEPPQKPADILKK